MGAPVSLAYPSDAYISSAKPTKNFGSVNRVYVGPGNYAFIYWGNPIPPKAKIISAKIILRNAETWAGSVTAYAQAIAVGWSANRITYNNRPGVTGAISSQAQTGRPGGSIWTLDVTAQMQAVANGQAWFGFRVWINGATKRSFWSAQASAGYRPVLRIEWSDAPLAPTDLVPRGGLATADSKPKFQFNFIDYVGNRMMGAYQVQIDDATNFLTPVYDSGEVASAIPEHDMDGTVWTSAESVLYYWRARVKDGSGFWSDWSRYETFVYESQIVVDITNPIGNPATVDDPSPTVTWSISNGPQAAYQIFVVDWMNPAAPVYDSGRVTSSLTSADIPAGVIKTLNKDYTLIVRAWDAIQRLNTPGFPTYGEDSIVMSVSPSGSETPVNSFVVTPDSYDLKHTLTFHRAQLPDSVIIWRNGEIIVNDQEPLNHQDATDPTLYTYVDFPPGRQTVTWQVLCIVNGASSDGNPTATRDVKRATSWLIARDGSLPVALFNPAEDMADGDLSTVVGEMGTASGRLIDDESLVDLTAKQQKENLRAIRRDKAGEAIFLFADETLKVFIYSVKIDRVQMPGGNTEYAVSFNLIETDSDS